MGILLMSLEVTVFQLMLCVEVLMSLFVRFVQLTVQAAMLPLRHRALMLGLMHIT